MTMGPEPRTRIFEISVLFGIYLMRFTFCHPDQVKLIANAINSRVEGPRVPVLASKPTPRSLDCEDRLLRRRSFSLGMTKKLSPLPLLHHLREFLEQIMRVVRTGRGLRVVLHAEQWQIPVAEAFQRLVVQVDV